MGMGTKKLNTMNTEQADIFNKLIAQITGRTGDAGGVTGEPGSAGRNYLSQGATPYTGQLSAGMNTGAWQDSQKYMAQALGIPLQSEQLSALSQNLSGTPSYKLDPQTTADYFNKGLAAPMWRMYQNEIAPRIAEGFASPGGVFNSRAGDAQARAVGDISTSLASELAKANQSNMSLEAQLAEQARARQLQAQVQSQSLASVPFQQGLLYQQGLANRQNQAQGGLDRQYQDFLRTAPENNPYNQLLVALLGEQTKAYTQDNTMSNIAGLGTSLGTLGLGLGSSGLGLFGGASQSSNLAGILQKLGL